MYSTNIGVSIPMVPELFLEATAPAPLGATAGIHTRILFAHLFGALSYPMVHAILLKVRSDRHIARSSADMHRHDSYEKRQLHGFVGSLFRCRLVIFLVPLRSALAPWPVSILPNPSTDMFQKDQTGVRGSLSELMVL